MKIISGSLVIILILALISGCAGNSSGKKGSENANDNITVPDTGFTGIKKYTSGSHLVKEVTFKNSVRNGLMKTFYPGGQTYQTFWFENGLREDSAKWYYPDGKVFRSTPFKHDTVDGIQIQYYKNGKIKAKLGYTKGLRNTFFEEYTPAGKLVSGYPGIVVNITDEYKSKGTYRIGLELSDKSTKVKFYRGEFTDNRFDTAGYKIIKTTAGKGTLILKKTGTATSGEVGVIAEILTSFGNKYLVPKNIKLPYNDLK